MLLAVLIVVLLACAAIGLRRQALGRWLAGTAESVIDRSTIDQLPLESIDRVAFYKRDELTTDLICCDVEIGQQARWFHEEQQGWDLLLSHLERLPGFKRDWWDSVVHRAFERCDTVVYIREQRPLRTRRPIHCRRPSRSKP